MRILYVLPAVKHPLMRGELRHYHFLRILSRRHQVTLLALARTDVAPEVLDELRACTERVVLVDAAPQSEQGSGRLARLRRRVEKVRRLGRGLAEVREAFRRTADEGSFDVALVNGHRMHRAVHGASTLPVVFDMCDAASMRLRQGLRHARRAELPWRVFRYWQVRRMEAAFRRTPHLAFISARDREAVLGAGSQAPIVPNGVDIEYWRTRGLDRGAHTLVFSGVLDYPPNADAALYLVTQVLPLVRRSVPEVEVVLAGRSPRADLLRASQVHPGVTVTGYVDDLRPHLERAAVCVAPLRFASGMQNKLLEAMAMELPVVTTGIAADGLRVDGERPPVRVGEHAEALASSVVTLLREPEERRQLGARGRAYVARHFDWERSAAMLEQLCGEAIESGAATRSAPAGAPGVHAFEAVSGEQPGGHTS